MPFCCCTTYCFLRGCCSCGVRCRCKGNIARLKDAGGNAVISGDAVASDALIGWCEPFVRAMQDSINQDTVEGEED